MKRKLFNFSRAWQSHQIRVDRSSLVMLDGLICQVVCQLSIDALIPTNSTTVALSTGDLFNKTAQFLSRLILMPSSLQPTPALSPPLGETSNFINPESLSKWITLCVTICLSVTGIVFLLRTYVRIVVKRKWILEDCEFSFSCRQSVSLTFHRYVLYLLGEQ